MTKADRTGAETASTGRAIDPITLSTVWHGFQSIGREMRHTIDRTAQSYLIAQLHDMAAGIWDVRGRTIAVPEGPTSMFLSQGFTVRYIMDKMGSTLRPGDVISTGTPGGVGSKRKPPRFLKAGDRVEIEISGVGLLANPVIDES